MVTMFFCRPWCCPFSCVRKPVRGFSIIWLLQTFLLPKNTFEKWYSKCFPHPLLPLQSQLTLLVFLFKSFEREKLISDLGRSDTIAGWLHRESAVWELTHLDSSWLLFKTSSSCSSKCARWTREITMSRFLDYINVSLASRFLYPTYFPYQL